MRGIGGKVPQLDISFGVTDEYAWSQHRVADASLAVSGYNVVGIFAGWAPQDGPLKGLRINAGIDAYKKALDANKKEYTVYVYDGVNHAFNNDTSAARYDKKAADLAWGRTIAFFKEKLG